MKRTIAIFRSRELFNLRQRNKISSQYEEIRSALRLANMQKNEKNKEISKLRQQERSMNIQRKDPQTVKELEELREQMAQKTLEIEKLTLAVNKYQEAAEKEMCLKQEWEQKNQVLKTKNEVYQERIKKKTKQIEKLMSEAKEYQDEIKKKQEKTNKGNLEIKKLLKEKEEENKQLQSQNKAYEEENKEKKRIVEELTLNVKAYQKETEKERKADDEVSKLKRSLEEMEQRNKQLQAENQAAQDQLLELKQEAKKITQSNGESLNSKYQKLVDELREKENQFIQEREVMTQQIQLLTLNFQTQVEQLKNHEESSKVKTSNKEISISEESKNDATSPKSNQTSHAYQLPPEFQVKADQSNTFLRNHQVPYEVKYTTPQNKKKDD